EKKAADLKRSVDDLTLSLITERDSAADSDERVQELEQQLKGANNSLKAGRTEAGRQNSTRERLEAQNSKLTEARAKAKAELDEERAAHKLSRKKEQELSAQIQKLKGAAEQAEARARESAAQSEDLEQKAAELKKNVDELTQNQTAEKDAAAQSAERVK